MYPDYPAEPILRYIPGTDSGTFDYCVEVVFDEDTGPILAANNTELSEDDNVLVTGVLDSPYAVAFFGFAYYLENADALNIIAQRPEMLKALPPNSILTPHPREFERLFGGAENSFKQCELLRKKAKEHQVFIVLKGAFTCTATPAGECFFNSTGNPGMATAGSGDVLTGIITGIIAQGYHPKDAASIGMFVHGLAGDFALHEQSVESLIASDIIASLGEAFKAIHAV